MADGDVADTMRGILAVFVLRARRVAAHSLARDEAWMTRLSRRMLQFDNVDGTVFVTETMPPEEQLESLAARVRPLILQEETAYYAKALNALGFFVKDDAQLREVVVSLRASWKATGEDQDLSGVFVQRVDPEGTPSRMTGDRELAYAYIYGDVVHHDQDRLAAVAEFDIDNRFRSAGPLVAQLAVLTMGTLNVVRAAQKRGLLELPENVWESPVVPTRTVFRNATVRVMLAEVGTVPPEMPEAFDESWTDMRDAMRTVCPDCRGELLPWSGAGGCLACRVSWARARLTVE